MRQPRKAHNIGSSIATCIKKAATYCQELGVVNRLIIALAVIIALILVPLIVSPAIQRVPFIMSLRSSAVRRVVKNDLQLADIPGPSVYQIHLDRGCSPEYAGFFQHGSNCDFIGESATVLSDSQLDTFVSVNKSLVSHGFYTQAQYQGEKNAFSKADLAALRSGKVNELSYFYNGVRSDSIEITIISKSDSLNDFIGADPPRLRRVQASMSEDKYIFVIAVQASFHY